MTKIRAATLLIRADASVAIGTGHVMRCLALAQGWQLAGGLATFVMAESTPAIEERLRGEDVGVARIAAAPGSDLDAGQVISLARKHHAEWLVVDGYEFKQGYQETLKNEGLRILLIDDNGLSETYAPDIVLNQNMHARKEIYKSRKTDTQLLLGPKYALLRSEFVCAPSSRTVPTIGSKILVSMGGSDPGNVTVRIIEAIEQVAIAGVEVAVVIGGSNPHLPSVAELVARSRHSCRIFNNVTNMRDLVLWADLGISAAGSACWEYCALGLPAILVAVAENQIANAEALHLAGAARLVAGGSSFLIDEMALLITRLVNSARDRQKVSRNARALVDGGGVGRVLSYLARREVRKFQKET